MSHSHASRHRGMSTTTLLAVKVALASAALAAAAFFARLAVPGLVSVAGAVFPRVWAVARFWLAPPYLFVTVHLIILVIWKLSDHKHFHHKQDPWPAVPAHHQHTAVAVKAKEEEEEEEFAGAYGGGHLEHPADRSSREQFSPDSGGGDSCVTTESDEDASSAPPSSYYAVEGLSRRSVVTFAPAQERAAVVVLERDLSSLPSQSQSVVDDCEAGDDDDDLDATWNAIMQKTRSAAPAPPAHTPPRARDPSVGAEEMNRRFEDFIKKNRNSFGRQ